MTTKVYGRTFCTPVTGCKQQNTEMPFDRCHRFIMLCSLTPPPPTPLSLLTRIKSLRLSSIAISSRDPTRLSLRPCTDIITTTLVSLSPGRLPDCYLCLCTLIAELFRFGEPHRDQYWERAGNGLITQRRPEEKFCV